jgi:hypothetical protein
MMFHFYFFVNLYKNKQPAAGDRTWAAGHGRGVLFVRGAAEFEALHQTFISPGLVGSVALDFNGDNFLYTIF